MTDTFSLSEQVAEEIRAVLGRRRMSGRQLANALGVSQTWMSTRLSGATPIDLNDLDRIARVFGLDVAALLPARLPEGRTVVVAGEAGRQTTVAKPALAKQPHPFGQPHHSVPKQSTRRPVRLLPAHS